MVKLTPFPEEGELVVGTVTTVQNFGAFVTLEEYPGKQGFCHIREVASGWVKRIRDHIREQQRLVFKVMQVDAAKGHIDLSLKAVNDHQRREAIQGWKNEQKADKLIEMFAERIGKPVEDVHQEVSAPLLAVWQSLFDAFQEIAERGAAVLKDEGLSAPWGAELAKFCKENIQATYVEIHGFVEVSSLNPDGVADVATALKAAEKSPFDDVQIQAAYKGAPVYRLTVKAPDYKIAEEQLKKAAERAIETMTKAGGSGEFRREMEA
jgi:translation initiation factor 2 subunit 1